MIRLNCFFQAADAAKYKDALRALKLEEAIIDAQRRNCFRRYAIMSDGHGKRVEAGRICVML